MLGSASGGPRMRPLLLVPCLLAGVSSALARWWRGGPLGATGDGESSASRTTGSVRSWSATAGWPRCGERYFDDEGRTPPIAHPKAPAIPFRIVFATRPPTRIPIAWAKPTAASCRVSAIGLLKYESIPRA